MGTLSDSGRITADASSTTAFVSFPVVEGTKNISCVIKPTLFIAKPTFYEIKSAVFVPFPTAYETKPIVNRTKQVDGETKPMRNEPYPPRLCPYRTKKGLAQFELSQIGILRTV